MMFNKNFVYWSVLIAHLIFWGVWWWNIYFCPLIIFCSSLSMAFIAVSSILSELPTNRKILSKKWSKGG